MSAVSHLNTDTTQRYLTGWTVSLLVHGGAVGLAVLLATGIHAPQPEPFQWNVSIMEPAPAPPAQAAAQSAASPSPAAPARPAEPAAPAAAPVHVEEPTAVTQPPPVASRPVPVEEPSPVIARSTPATPPVPAAQEPVTAISKPTLSEPVATPPAQHSPGPSSPESVDTRSRASEAVAAAPSAASASSAKKDYGWLAEALWGRIEQLKRYPATARLNRWEGKVVLRAVIKEDGRIADLRIAHSSGHDVLDQDALSLMQQASPVPLKQPLGHPQVVVHIPISYKLEQ